MIQFLVSLFAAGSLAPGRLAPAVQATDSLDLVRLERLWNEAHLQGDTVALGRLWADDMMITVPAMPVMSKADAMRFWRTGRSNIARYETTGLRLRIYASSAVVTGELHRERNFNGQTVSDHWRFIKVYVRREGRWQVVAYQATPAAP